VRAATSVPAGALGLVDRGLLRAGARADLTVLAADGSRSLMVWLDGSRLPEGP
jgi:N-acyl-D-aspartate/D-glutamate deacylase